MLPRKRRTASRTRGSCGHSASTFGIRSSSWSALPQRRRETSGALFNVRLRLHGEAATRRNTTSFTSTLIAAGLARSGEVCLRHAWSRVWVFGVTGVCGRLSGLSQFYMRVQPYKYRPTKSARALFDGRYLTGKDRKKRIYISALRLFCVS